MSSPSNIPLFCIVIYDDLKAHDSDSVFSVTVPSHAHIDSVISSVMDAMPSLNCVDRSKFRLYKPPPNFPITCNSSSVTRVQLTESEFSNHLPLPLKVHEAFPEKDDTQRFNIDVIVRVSLAEHGRFSKRVFALMRNRLITAKQSQRSPPNPKIISLNVSHSM